eukprot:scpid103086/ scgid33561/ 
MDTRRKQRSGVSAPVAAVEPPAVAAASTGMPKRSRTATAAHAATSPSRAPDSTDTSNLQALTVEEVQRAVTVVTNTVQLLLALPDSALPPAASRQQPRPCCERGDDHHAAPTATGEPDCPTGNTEKNTTLPS